MPMVVIRCRFQGQQRKRKSLVSLRFFMFFQLVSRIHLSRLLLAMYHQQEFLPGLTNKKILYLDLNAQHAWWYEFYLRLLFSPQLIDFISSTKTMYQVKKPRNKENWCLPWEWPEFSYIFVFKCKLFSVLFACFSSLITKKILIFFYCWKYNIFSLCQVTVSYFSFIIYNGHGFLEVPIWEVTLPNRHFL